MMIVKTSLRLNSIQKLKSKLSNTTFSCNNCCNNQGHWKSSNKFIVTFNSFNFCGLIVLIFFVFPEIVMA